MCLLNISWCFLIISLLFLTTSQTESVEIHVKQGTLKGTSLKSRNGTNYYAFYGIPFAKPPVGHLRFKSPQEPDQWTGARYATTPPPPCNQMDLFSFLSGKDPVILGQEDCLYLNVFTPKMDKSELLPTMVSIHGGAFSLGGAFMGDAVHFMDYPVVMVVIQYRLGILGFLSAADEELPGNFGMKDQVAALKWVQQNIKAFGGNPNKVTIFGQSAGGVSTHLHMHSSLSKGLFHQAISQSGTALESWVLTTAHTARVKAFAVGALSGCYAKSTRALVDCLRKVPATELVKTHEKFRVWDLSPLVPFPLVVESKNVDYAFLTESPRKQDIINKIPWLAGITSDEGRANGMRYLANDKLLAELNTNYKHVFPILFEYGSTDEMNTTEVELVTEAIRKFYFDDSEISLKNARKLFDLFSDSTFTLGCLKASRRHTENKLFLYLYDHLSVNSSCEYFGKIDIEDPVGPCHGDDISNFMGSFGYLPNITDGPDLTVSHRLLKYWVNFAYNGNPSGDEGLWKPSESKDLDYLHIMTEEDVMKTNFKNLFPERYNFWAGLRPLLNPTSTSQHVKSPENDEL